MGQKVEMLMMSFVNMSAAGQRKNSSAESSPNTNGTSKE